ncbi:sulfatase-like hydrolase/transferase [Myxococcota bacterium]|nr:sulfatase-like hydrolase/transferase [Myxococcota bacterium]
MNPPRPLTPSRAALLYGVSAGLFEVALRASPRLGLGLGEMFVWLFLGAAAGAGVTAGLSLTARLLRASPLLGARPVGFAVGGLLALHAGLSYRFERVLNLPVKDPEVWGGLLLIGALCLAVGLLFDRLWRALTRPVVALGVIAAWAGLLRGVPPSVTEPGPRVLIITWDTTRADRLSVYGGPAKTPTLDRLAREGVVFERATSVAPLTEPAHLSILTGRSPARTGVVVNGTELGDRPELLSWAAQEAGLRTGAAVSGFPLHAKYGWSQGFDLYDDDFGAIPGLHRLSLIRAWEQLFLPGNTLRERVGTRTVSRAERFMARYGAGSWLYWLHLFDPHGPYEALPLTDAPTGGAPLDLPPYWPPPHRQITSTDWLIRAYDAEIERADALTGQLLDQLDALGVLDDTIIVLTADHGESLTEHDYLFEHGDNLYDPSLRVPLIIRAPGKLPAGARVPCQVSNLDVTPTVRALLGWPTADLDGRDLTPLVGGGCVGAPVVSSAPGGRFINPPIDFSYRTEQEKLIVHGLKEGETGTPKVELYDLVADPGELNDLSAERDSQQLGARLAPSIQAFQGARSGASGDADTEAALKALGYLDEAP